MARAIENRTPPAPDQTRPTAYPATFDIDLYGDSGVDAFGANVSDYDAGPPITAGITAHVKGATLGANWTAGLGSDGLVCYVAEDAIARAGVSAVRIVSRGVSGSFNVNTRRDQISLAGDDREGLGWSSPHLIAVVTDTNDVSVNGTGVDGTWNTTVDTITALSTTERYRTIYHRLRALHPEAVIVIVGTIARVGDFPSVAVVESAKQALVTQLQADGDVNVRYTQSNDLSQDDNKHINPDATPNDGAAELAKRIIDAYFAG